MKVENIKRDSRRLSASIDGFDLWFDVPNDFGPHIPGDVFLCASLLIAMKQGETLTVDAPCSRELLANCRGALQDVFTAWYPDLRRVDVTAPTAEAAPVKHGVGSFFSGGVDGLYTFFRNREEITHLISIQGVDVQVDNDSLWGKALAANRAFANSVGKTLIPMRTNLRRWCHPNGVDWVRYHGSGLAACAHAVGLGKCFIAGSHTLAELFPWGSHPLTDRLWGSEAVEIVHDGAESRAAKVTAIGQHPEAMRTLRVCWQDQEYNCGKCEKCLRTRTTLRLLGMNASTLEPLTDPRELRHLKIWEPSDESFFADNLKLAEQVGDEAIAEPLRKILRNYRFRRGLAGIDRDLLGGAVHRLKRIFKR